MAIYTLKGNIIEVAPDQVEVMVLWINKAYNARFALWFAEISAKIESLKLAGLISNDGFIPNGTRKDLVPSIIMSNEMSHVYPWKSHYDTLWEVLPPIQKTRYLYIFSNPGDKQVLPEFNMVKDYINRCLTQLAKMNVKSCAMIHIPASETIDHHTNEDDIRSASMMVESINNWINENNYNIDVYLVDRTDDFKNQL